MGVVGEMVASQQSTSQKDTASGCMPTTGTHPADREGYNDKLGDAEKENNSSDMKPEHSLKFQGQSPNYSTPSGAAHTFCQ